MGCEQSAVRVTQQVWIDCWWMVHARPVFHLEHVRGISGKMAAFESIRNGLFINHGTTSHIHQIAARLHSRDGSGVDKVQRGIIQWQKRYDNIALLQHFFETEAADTQQRFFLRRKRHSVRVNESDVKTSQQPGKSATQLAHSCNTNGAAL